MTENRTPEQIASDISATRDRLIASLDEVVARSQPEVVARQQLEKLRAFYVDEHGGVRTDRAAKTAGVFAALLVLRKLFK